MADAPAAAAAAAEKTLDEVYEQRTWLFMLACTLAREVNDQRAKRGKPILYLTGLRKQSDDAWPALVLKLPFVGEISIHAKKEHVMSAPSYIRDLYPGGDWDGSNDTVQRIRRYLNEEYDEEELGEYSPDEEEEQGGEEYEEEEEEMK